MFGVKKLLTRRQIKQICQVFKCEKNDFVVGKLGDGYLISVKNKEYRVKFSEGFRAKVVYVREVQRMANNRPNQELLKR